jgi:hypothetical protein
MVLARRPSRTQVCCRHQSSHCIQCLSPGQLCPTSLVSMGSGLQRPNLLRGWGPSQGHPKSAHLRLSPLGRWEDPPPPCSCLSVILFAQCCLLLGLGGLASWVRAPWLPRPSQLRLRETVLPFPDQKCNLHLPTAGGNQTLGDYQTQWWDAPSILGLIIFLLCTLFIRYGDCGLRCRGF